MTDTSRLSTLSNFPLIEITPHFGPECFVAGQPRRNNSLTRETIFRFWRADIPKRGLTNNPPNETPNGAIGSLSCRTSSPSTLQPRSISRAHATSDEMLLERLPTAAGPRCISFIPAIMFGSTVSSCASCAIPRWPKTSSARFSWTSGAPPASSRAAPRFPPGCCRSRASRR